MDISTYALSPHVVHQQDRSLRVLTVTVRICLRGGVLRLVSLILFRRRKCSARVLRNFILGRKIQPSVKKLLGLTDFDHRAMHIFTLEPSADDLAGEAMQHRAHILTVICLFRGKYVDKFENSQMVQVVLRNDEYTYCAASLYTLMSKYLKIRVYPEAYVGSEDGLNVSSSVSSEARKLPCW